MHDLLMQAVSDVLTAAFLAALGLIVRLALLEWRRFQPKVDEWLAKQVDASTRELLSRVGREAFVFAETAYQQLSGPERLQYALDYASKVLNQYGVKVTPEEISAVIHSAWLEDKRAQVAAQAAQSAVRAVQSGQLPPPQGINDFFAAQPAQSSQVSQSAQPAQADQPAQSGQATQYPAS